MQQNFTHTSLQKTSKKHIFCECNVKTVTCQSKIVTYKTGVINDPLGQNHVSPVANIIFALFVL